MDLCRIATCFAFVFLALVLLVSATTNVPDCSYCHHFANCTTINSTLATCTCKTNFVGNGTFCDVQAVVDCASDVASVGYAIRISVDKDYFDYYNFTLSDLRLLNDSCNPVIVGGDYTFIVPTYSSCGTVQTKNSNSSKFVYSNYVSTDGVAAFGTVHRIPVSCVLDSTVALGPTNGNGSSIVISMGPNSKKIVFSPVVGTSSITATMYLFKDQNYTQAYNGIPLLTTTDMLYAEVLLEPAINSFYAVIEKCWATPGEDDSEDIYDFIEQPGCMKSSVTGGSITQNGEFTTGRFQFQVFKWVNSPSVFLYCTVSLCDPAAEICKPDCSSSRRKREAKNRLTGNLRSILVILAEPVDIPKNTSEDVPKPPTTRLRIEFIILCCVAGVALLICIILITYLCCLRRKRKIVSN